MSARKQVLGFTLLEALLVIVLTGVIAGAVALFIQAPVQGYFDAVRRAELGNAAHAALSQIGRELRQALPNSVRVHAAAGVHYLEFVPTVAAGRYAGNGESCFTTAGCTAIGTLGDMVGAAGEQVGNDLVIFNYYNNAGGDCGASLPSAYCGHNRAAITASSDGGAQDGFSFAAKQFLPLGGSPGHRFQIAAGPVSYVCDPATHRLSRYSGYGWQAVQPTAFGGGELVADRISACTFAYQSGAYARHGIVSLRLALADGGESVSLLHQIHVDNSP